MIDIPSTLSILQSKISSWYTQAIELLPNVVHLDKAVVSVLAGLGIAGFAFQYLAANLISLYCFEKSIKFIQYRFELQKK